MIFSMPLGLEISYFDGWCRYGSDNREWINGFEIKDDAECYEKCKATNDCVAFSFEYSNVDEPCNTYRGGPYTYGNGRSNTKCYIMPKGRALLLQQIFVLLLFNFPCITLPETALIFFSLIKGARDDFEVGNDSSDSVQIIRTPKTFEKNATLEDLIRATLSDVKFSDFLKQKGM